MIAKLGGESKDRNDLNIRCRRFNLAGDASVVDVPSESPSHSDDDEWTQARMCLLRIPKRLRPDRDDARVAD